MYIYAYMFIHIYIYIYMTHSIRMWQGTGTEYESLNSHDTYQCNKSRDSIRITSLISFVCVMWVDPLLKAVPKILQGICPSHLGSPKLPSVQICWHSWSVSQDLRIRCVMRCNGKNSTYGVATISRLLKITGLFCRVSSLLYGSFAKETYTFKEPTHRSHPIGHTRAKCRKCKRYVLSASIAHAFVFKMWENRF